METWALVTLIVWSLFATSFFAVGGIKIYKFFKKKKKRTHLTLIQGGKKDGPYDNLSN